MRGDDIMLKMWLNYFKTLTKSNKGQGMVEYGLIIGLIAVVLIGVLITMREQLAVIFGKISAALTTAASS